LGPQSLARIIKLPPAAFAADRARIAEIDAQILELIRSHKSLKEERNLLQDRLDAYTYPVLTLPNEIVSEIFVHFLPVYPRPPPILGPLSPNLLGQICQEWREIALTTPALWRAISLSLRRSERIQQKLRLLEISLERSGCCPLSISLDMGNYTNNQGTLDPFLRTIARHCARWEHLKLYSLVHPFPSIEGPLPLLRSVLMGSIMNEEHSSTLISIFHTAPRLRKVALSFLDAIYISFFPWSQLNVLSSRFLRPRDVVDILIQATNLVYCDLHTMTSSRWSDDPGPRHVI
jgi:hypothetical protein